MLTPLHLFIIHARTEEEKRRPNDTSTQKPKTLHRRLTHDMKENVQRKIPSGIPHNVRGALIPLFIELAY